MKLSVIVPVYNEEATVAKLLKKLFKAPAVTEVVIVNDGSTDNTFKEIKKAKTALRRFQRQQNPKTKLKVKVIDQINGGKGNAVRRGLKEVIGDYVLIQDADLEYDPEDITALLEPIKKGKAEVVYGSRFLGPHSNLLFWHRVGNNFLNLVVNILYDTTLSDMETCYKVLPRELFQSLNLRANSFELEPEITCKVLKKGVRIFEVPISYVGRDFSEGKKISWRDGFSALWMIFKLRF